MPNEYFQLVKITAGCSITKYISILLHHVNFTISHYVCAPCGVYIEAVPCDSAKFTNLCAFHALGKKHYAAT